MSKTPIEALLEQVDWKPTGGAAEHQESDLPYATHEGIVKIGDMELRCYQLNTGQVILNADDVHKFFGGVLV